MVHRKKGGDNIDQSETLRLWEIRSACDICNALVLVLDQCCYTLPDPSYIKVNGPMIIIW